MGRFGLLERGARLHALTFFVTTAFFVAVLGAPASSQDESRRFSFRYAAKIGPIESGSGPVHVFVPMPRVTEQQKVLSATVKASINGKVEVETTHGNVFWHGVAPEVPAGPIMVQIDSVIERGVHSVVPASGPALNDEERKLHASYLGPNERVVVAHEILDPILAEIRAARKSDAPADSARAIYDWVVDNVEYKKVGTGWGNGDTFWACSERYGNCTDFHALFTSLARTEGIPARFEIGFPVPDDRPAGDIGGYHCWVQFYLPGTGWVPIDASEAFKHPEKREMFFGTHPADRIHLTTGRDLQLGPDHKGKPLNYFVYPHVEVGGVPWEGEIEKAFRFGPAEEEEVAKRTSEVR